MKNNTLVVGIAGGTGSGKSTFTNSLKNIFGKEITTIYYDNYYKSRDGVSEEDRKKINYDHPDALETDLLISHLRLLKSGQSIESPVYNFVSHTRNKETISISPNRIVVVEGILTFHNPELRDLLDLKIYVDSDADERILRRTIRDIECRGRKIEDVMSQYLTTVKPMHYLYVEPTKQYADIILTGGINPIALDVITSKLKLYLNNI